MMRKTIIAGNWKMYKTIGAAIDLANGLKRELFEVDADRIDIVLCPPFTVLTEIWEVIENSNMRLGGQDMFWKEEGAFTGEVSGTMLKDAGCQYCIIGHSERRQFFAETNETVNLKVKAALACGLSPIMCVGEMLAEREKGQTFAVLQDQVENGLTGIPASEMSALTIAYEPAWAIGTGKTATPAQAQEAQIYIRSLLAKLYDKEIADAMRIQYGGSVKPDNITELMQQPDVDGALVGGASLSVESFAAIVKKASEVKK